MQKSIQQFFLFEIDIDVPHQGLGTYDKTEKAGDRKSEGAVTREFPPIWEIPPWGGPYPPPLLKQMMAKVNHELLTKSSETAKDWDWDWDWETIINILLILLNVIQNVG